MAAKPRRAALRGLLLAALALACSADPLPPPPAQPLAAVGALVVLGDAISSRDDPAHYHRLLHARLEERLGAPVYYLNSAFSSARASDLLLQIDALPADLPGPVAVVITAGCNDMKAAFPAIADGEDAGPRARLAHDIGAAHDALLAPGRFGEGVAVHVFEANLFDPSDGAGDYADRGCPFGAGLPALPTDPAFAAWNAALAEPVRARDQALLDLHALFRGHGLAAAEPWYDDRCLAPNEPGHLALAAALEDLILGDP